MNRPVITRASGKTHALKARKGVFFAKDDFRLRKFDQGVSLDAVSAALDKNGFDEVVFKTDAGERYVIYAENLKGRVDVGDGIEIQGLQGKVEMVDDEPNRKRRAAVGLAVVGVLGLAGGAALGAVGGVAFTAAVTGNVITGGAQIGALMANTALGTVGGSVAGGAGASATGMVVAHKTDQFVTKDKDIQKISAAVVSDE